MKIVIDIPTEDYIMMKLAYESGMGNSAMKRILQGTLIEQSTNAPLVIQQTDSETEYWKERAKSYERTIVALQKGITETQTEYKWCKGCKEYDTENHCCHRYSSFIRESLQENVNSVLEGIKAELQTLADDEWNQQVMADKGLEMAIEIIENYINRKE